MPTLKQLQEQLAEEKNISDKDECSSKVNVTKARICMLNTYTPEARAALGAEIASFLDDDDLMGACMRLIAVIAAADQKKAMAQVGKWAIYYRDVSKMSRAQMREFKQLVATSTGEEE